jgi:insertion element IS1 protein InsB
VTDDWEGFQRIIPQERLFTGKDLTFPIEQDNSDVRHHLARFRRRSKVTSRARHMVDGALKLLCHLRRPVPVHGRETPICAYAAMGTWSS